MAAYVSTSNSDTMISPSIIKMTKDDAKPFCDYCEEVSCVLGSGPSEYVEMRHHENYQDFCTSAECCPLCCLIVQGLRELRDDIVGIRCSCHNRQFKIHVEYFQGCQSKALTAPLEEDLSFELFQNRGKGSFESSLRQN